MVPQGPPGAAFSPPTVSSEWSAAKDRKAYSRIQSIRAFTCPREKKHLVAPRNKIQHSLADHADVIAHLSPNLLQGTDDGAQRREQALRWCGAAPTPRNTPDDCSALESLMLAGPGRGRAPSSGARSLLFRRHGRSWLYRCRRMVWVMIMEYAETSRKEGPIYTSEQTTWQIL